MGSDILHSRDFSKEFKFKTSRSSGPGGQNVNKVNSKVELRINVLNSLLFTEMEKMLLKQKLSNQINSDEELIIVSQTERTQFLNKKKCIQKFYFMITTALTPAKKRKPSTPTFASKRKRIEKKIIASNKKELRRKPDL
jgi:ribosome-associated protein